MNTKKSWHPKRQRKLLVSHYSPAIGEYELRQAIRDKNVEFRGFTPEIDQVMVSPGANILIYFMIACIMNPGEEIILPNPCFSSYISIAKFCDVNPVFVELADEQQFHMRPEDVLKRISPLTKAVLLNSPHNPTGAVMTKEEIDEIADICSERDIYLISDEIYRWLNYSNERNYSASVRDHCRENVLVIDGFSKAYAMTGWRLGYAIAPPEIINKMQLLLETICSCVPAFVQLAGVEALLGNQQSIVRMRETYDRRRKLFVNGLNGIRGIECAEPNGAFYIFPNVERSGLSDREFAERLLEEEGVGVVPGTDFGYAGKGHIRLCYAADEEDIREGIRRIENFVNHL